MNNILTFLLRTRTRNARTRAKADALKPCGLLHLAGAGRTMRNECRIVVPSVCFCGLTYVYRERNFVEIQKIINEHCKIRTKLFAKNNIRKIVKSTLQNTDNLHFISK